MKIFMLLSLLIGSFTWAATDATSTESIEAPRPTSTMIRGQKKFMIAAALAGQNPAGVFGPGLDFGFFFTDNSMLTLELSGGGTIFGYDDWNGSDSYTDYREYHEMKEGYSLGLAYKYFLGNTFYIKSGADFKTLRYKYTMKDNGNSAANTSRKFSGDTASLSFAVGNQWQFKYLTLGCDWFGLDAPILSRVYNVEYSATADGQDRKDNRQDINRYVTGLGVNVLRFYVGASF